MFKPEYLHQQAQNAKRSREQDESYVSREVDKIIAPHDSDSALVNSNLLNSNLLNYVMSIAWLVLHFKGTNLKILDMREISALTDYSILADVKNPLQAQTIAEEIVEQMKRNHFRCRGKEGGANSNWTLIDLNQIVVHLFIEQSRKIYDLESLWANALEISVPESFHLNLFKVEV